MNDRLGTLILAGGLGTRLRPITETTPKCLVPIHGRPLLAYWIDRLVEAGVPRARINNHHLPDQLRTYIDEVNNCGEIILAEAYEPELLGSAGTIAANADVADDVDDVLIIYADNLTNVDLNEFVGFHRSHDDPMSMLAFRTQNPTQCGIVVVDDNDRVVEFIEKPENPPSDLANGGLYLLRADAYREIAAMNAFDIAFDVLPRFIGKMRVWQFDGYLRDIGTIEALQQAEREAPEVFACA